MYKYLISVRIVKDGCILQCNDEPNILIRWLLHDDSSYQLSQTQLHTNMNPKKLQSFLNEYFNSNIIVLKYV